MLLFLIRTRKPTFAQLHSRNEYNYKLRLGLSKKIRNSVNAGQIYHRSKGIPWLPVRSFSKCLSSWEHDVLQTPVSLLSSERGTDSGRCGLGKINVWQLGGRVAWKSPTWCSRDIGCCWGSHISGGFSALLAALEQSFLLVWPRSYILDMKV